MAASGRRTGRRRERRAGMESGKREEEKERASWVWMPLGKRGSEVRREWKTARAIEPDRRRGW